MNLHIKKPGRNEPCPCGSGKKYKKCCLNNPAVGGTFIYTDLDMLSNKVNELIKDGRLAEAEDTCRILMKKYPDQIDGLHRYAEVYEAMGEKQKASRYYRKAANFAEQSDGFEQETIDLFLRQAQLLAGTSEE